VKLEGAAPSTSKFLPCELDKAFFRPMPRLSDFLHRLLGLILPVAGILGACGGQDPSLPKLSCTLPNPTTALLQWQSADGDSYKIERCDDLNSGSWNAIGDAFPGTGQVISFSEPMVPGRSFYRLEVTPALPIAVTIACMGDSITVQGSTNLIYLSSLGYFSWAQVFGGSRWSMASSGSSFCFATSGKRSDEVSALHRSQVLASGAQACVLAYGTNDAFQMVPTSSFVNQAVSDWKALRAGGVEPIAVTVPPIGSVTTYYTAEVLAARQSRVAEYNVALRQSAAAHHVALCDWTIALEAVPGSNNGVGLDSYYINNDNLHPKSLGASKMGRILSATISSHFRTTQDPWSNANWITPNAALAGTSGQPHSQWNLYPPSGGSVSATNLIPSDKGNWWEIGITPGSSAGTFNMISFAANLGGSPSGKKVEAISEIQVVEGSLDYASLQLYTNGVAATALGAGDRAGVQVTQQDGIIVLRTPATVVDGSATQAIPSLYFNTSRPEGAIVRVRRCGVRLVD
jgi:lysophospholipase L1-like esterase